MCAEKETQDRHNGDVEKKEKQRKPNQHEPIQRQSHTGQSIRG